MYDNPFGTLQCDKPSKNVSVPLEIRRQGLIIFEQKDDGHGYLNAVLV